MTKEKPDESVFDISRIRDLIELMKEHDLSEVNLKQADKRIRLRRGSDAPVMMTTPIPPAGGASSGPAPHSVSAAADAESVEDDNAVYITSPTVGTFYAKPKPDAPTFVKVGDHVQPDTVVCLVEAMKMFNEIPAGVSGKIVAVLVENESPVEVNKPLFKVMPD